MKTANIKFETYDWGDIGIITHNIDWTAVIDSEGLYRMQHCPIDGSVMVADADNPSTIHTFGKLADGTITMTRGRTMYQVKGF